MARVPLYDSANVAPTTSGIAAPDIEAGQIAGQQVQKFGDAMQGAGAQASYVGDALQNQANQTRVQDAANQATNAATALRYGSDANGVHSPGYAEVAGENVMHTAGPDGVKAPLAVAYPQMLQQKLQAISSTLTPQQQQMFSVHAGALSAQFQNEVSAHQAQQFTAWKSTVNTDTLTSSANSVASILPQIGTPTFDAVSSTALANTQSAIDRVLADQGVMRIVPNDPNAPPLPNGQPAPAGSTHLEFADDAARNVYDTESKALMGKWASTVVQAGVNNQQAPAAQAFLATLKSNLAPDDYAAINARVNQAAMGTNAISQVDNVMAKFWPDQTKPPNEMQIDAALRAANPTNSQQLEASRQEMQARVGQWSFTQGAQQKQAGDQASAAIANGQTLSQIQASPVWNQLSGDQQLEFTDKAHSFSSALQSSGGMKGFDAVYGSGRYGTPSVPISQMTMGDVQNYQSGVLIPATRGKIGAGPTLGSGAVGAYQINYDTLKQYAPQVLGANWKSQPFSPANQYAIAQAIWNANRGGDMHNIWTSLSHNAPGAYANTSFAQMAGTIAQGESGGVSPSKTDQAIAADGYLADPSSIGPMTPQNQAVIIAKVGPQAGARIIKAGQIFQNQLQHSAMASEQEVSSVLGGLGISPTAKDAQTVQQRVQVRADLNDAFMAATQSGQKQLTPDQRLEIAQKTAAISVQVPGTLWGTNSVPLLSMHPSDLGNIVVPDADAGSIKAQLHAAGHPVDDTHVRQVYLHRLIRGSN